MALTQLTYEDKETLVNQPDIAAKNKITAGDMNEIKTVVNGACTQVDTNTGEISTINGKLVDTGWIDMSAYVNTTYFAIRTGDTPMARKIGKVVYWKGSVYCTTAPNSQTATVLSGIPSQYLPNYEYGTSVITWYIGENFSMHIGGNGSMEISKDTNIGVQYDWAGIQLSNISGYIVD